MPIRAGIPRALFRRRPHALQKTGRIKEKERKYINLTTLTKKKIF